MQKKMARAVGKCYPAGAMATYVQLIDALAAATGEPRALVDGFGRALRADGLIADRPRGRGSNAVEVTTREGVHQVLAPIAGVPSKAPRIVREICDLAPVEMASARVNKAGDRFVHFGQTAAYTGTPHTLGDQLTLITDAMVNDTPEGRAATEARLRGGNAVLIVNPAQQNAMITWSENGETVSQLYEAPLPSPSAPAQGELLPTEQPAHDPAPPAPRAQMLRQTIIPLVAFLVVAELIAAGRNRQAVEPPASEAGGDDTSGLGQALPAGRKSERPAPGRASLSRGVAQHTAATVAGPKPMQSGTYDDAAVSSQSQNRELGLNISGAGNVGREVPHVGPPSPGLRAA